MLIIGLLYARDCPTKMNNKKDTINPCLIELASLRGKQINNKSDK